MFDKDEFARIIRNIKETYNSQEEFSEKSGIGRTYLSQYMNAKLDKPPKPAILKKLANASNNITTYKELMKICGYSKQLLENRVSNIYIELKNYHKYINNGKINEENSYQIQGFIEDFQKYIVLLDRSITLELETPIFLTNIFYSEHIDEDYEYVGGFLTIYNQFLKTLESENFITVKSYQYIDCFNIEDLYGNLTYLKYLELLSYVSKNVEINKNCNLSELILYIDSFLRCLNLAHLSEYDNNSLIEFFKKIVSSSNTETTQNTLKNISDNSKLHMCPVYGQISAGQPNWAEECLEGYLPIDPNLMGIINPEQCFFLRVKGESMNQLIKNGAYALIRKQDIVENGEVAVVLVNGDEATLKKFTQHGDVIVLEPMSDDPNFKTQIYDKNTRIQILGKYIGKFEMKK